ncbi:MAG: ABC transporter ATP-binding protein [Bdellovibrionales bacterium RIFCSPHIGHO2_01_FULL_40_29]|nr:MAG: ABC transporter ATP-binding protein [Bdellovibrionales bacterium RIFCSPHIGHO2_01_FULL_40_29]OFZ32793.1 MAG: ABC transporter ATP-binding protein [Bdellovibrionales bacterium RIFCSPHIGHO2_02_FULL_40_15]
MGYLLEAHDIFKNYPTGATELPVLKGVSLQIQKGEAICLLGASGAGKSTLLQILGTLDRPTSGNVTFRGEDLFKMSDEELSQFRNQKMGFVFQFHHLIQEFTALENVMLPALIAGEKRIDIAEKAYSWLKFMGLEDRVDHYPNQLSGGELQRVAIARALIKDPEILFADEPTGNLDSENSLKIQQLFFELRQKLGLTLIVVTHDLQFSGLFPRVFKVKDGRFAQ